VDHAEVQVKPGAGDGEPVDARRAALYRLAFSIGGVAITSLIGGAGVIAVYYPLRHAAFGFQWLLVFALMAGESMAIHLPSEVILPVGGWLVVREHGLGVEGVLALSAIAAAGNTLGSGLLYAAGRARGRPLVRRYGRFVLIHESDIDDAERRMRAHTRWALLLTRMLPVVRTYAGFVAGVLRVPVAEFVAITFAGSFVWCVAFVGAGAALGSHWGAVRLPAEIAGVTVLAALLVIVVVVSVRHLRPRPARSGREA
jgi:membrane protein DedA with SNARE-associated domain